MTDVNHYLGQIDTWGLREKNFEHKVLDMMDNVTNAIRDISNRITTLEAAPQIGVDPVELENLRVDITQVANDVTLSNTLNQAEIAVLHQKLDGCSWCAKGQLGAIAP